MKMTKNNIERQKQILNDLLEFKKSFDEIGRDDIGWGNWQYEPLAIVKRSHIVSIINRYLKGELSSQKVYEWAESIHGRETIDFEHGYGGVISHFLLRVVVDNQLENIITPEYIKPFLDEIQNAAIDPKDIVLDYEKLPDLES